MQIDNKLVQFISPFSMIIAGPSGSGKSQLVRRFLKNHKLLFYPSYLNQLNVCWVYGVWQNVFSHAIDDVNIDYTDRLPTEEDIIDKKPDIIIIDDLMNEVGDEKHLGNLFTKMSHHHNFNIIFIAQNLFHQGKQMRNLHLNSHYLVLMRNPRDLTQIDILGRQLKITKALDEAYKDATKNSFGYLLIDFKQTTPKKFMLKSRLTPEESKSGTFSPIIYSIR